MRCLPSFPSFCALIFTLLPLPVPAGAAQAAVPPPKKLTLAQALAAAPPAGDGLWLTVSAEQVTLPEGAEVPPPEAGTGDIAAAFGDQTVSFGTVTAVAPATMAVLNTQPEAPDIGVDLNSIAALNMLSASLNDAQWKMLTSENGLGLADLTDDTQRVLFRAFFPHGQLWVTTNDPAQKELPPEKRTDVSNLSDQIDSTRLRLGQTAHIYLHDTQGKTLFFSSDRPAAGSNLHTWHPKFPPAQNEYGVTLRAVAANTLKSSDLDWDSRALQTAVTPAGLKTVGDLVTQAGKQAGLELYADPHYASRTLTVFGTAQTASAADLLQAVCLCVTGTFRKVGPAYVLTDDLTGVGVRRKRLQDWDSAAFNSMMALERKAGAVMLEHRAADSRTLPAFGDPLALTPEEIAALPDSPDMPGIPKESENSYPFAKLTPAQQSWMRQTAAAYDDQHHSNALPSYLSGDALADADVTHNVDLNANIHFQLLVPSVGTPVETSLSYPVWMLFYPGDTAQARQTYAKIEADTLAKLPPAPLLSAALRVGRCRAVLAHPRSASDVDSLVTAMQKLGLNTLILDVFSDGINHSKTSAASGRDILTEALLRTRGTGVAVFADLSLLSWGDSPPDAVQDLTIDGQNTRQEAITADQAKPDDEHLDDEGKPTIFVAPPVQVSPTASQVRQTLSALIKDITARPGLAGFVWEDAGTDYDLGYTPDMRLAFLRSAHADPVDITLQDYMRADVSLPLFDDKSVDDALSDRWKTAKTKADTEFLSQLRTAARRSDSVGLPILMEQELGRTDWLASWDDPSSRPPSARDLSPDNDFPPATTIRSIARKQGQLVLRREAVENDGDTAALARKLTDDAKALPGDGFVLDFHHDEVTQGAAPLDSLVRAVSANNAVK